MSKIEYFNEDCVIGMARYPDKYFDLAICDPPYGIGASRPSKKPERVIQKNGRPLKVESNKYEHKNWDDIQPSHSYFEELSRVSKHQIIWGINYFNINLPSSGRLVWDKMNGDSDQFGCEIAYNSFNRRTDIVRFMWSGMIQGVVCTKNISDANRQQGNKGKNERRIHPTQKPVALYKWLLKNYAKPNDKILDTHVGSASSLIACYDMGFDAVGFELDADYYKASKQRLEDFMAQPKIEEVLVSNYEQLSL